MAVSLGRERLSGSFHPFIDTMPTRVLWYIAAITTAAGLAILLLAAWGPPATQAALLLVLFLCFLGGMARRLNYDLEARGAHGNVGFILFIAAAAVSASWLAPAAVATTMVVTERMRGAAFAKIVFNSAQLALANALGIGLYLIIGGTPWAEGVAPTFLVVVGVLALSVSITVLSTAQVVGTLALLEKQSYLQQWRLATRGTATNDMLLAPTAGVLAYAAVMWGIVPTGIIALTLIAAHRLHLTNMQLTRMSQELLDLMVSAIEARDPYTSGHSKRVSRLAMVIARAAGLDEREVRRVAVAGLLHDVGKIHEKYAPILSKPDRLSKHEWMVMQQHPVDGASLVDKVSHLRDIVPAVRHHHEAWDGSGYPDNLVGDSIPLVARIIALADTIDAMTSDRPYRRALTEMAVRKEIEACSGKQFDPNIASALLASPHWSKMFAPVSNSGRYKVELVREA